MIVYESSCDFKYKIPAIVDFNFIHPKSVVSKRPLYKLTSENCAFLKKIGLTLKKKSC